jgi:hypothetical protein
VPYVRYTPAEGPVCEDEANAHSHHPNAPYEPPDVHAGMMPAALSCRW